MRKTGHLQLANTGTFDDMSREPSRSSSDVCIESLLRQNKDVYQYVAFLIYRTSTLFVHFVMLLWRGFIYEEIIG
jgi:hypothetical protein